MVRMCERLRAVESRVREPENISMRNAAAHAVR
jgi:hypothetical protein